jgi:hypothetical protein
MVFDIKNNVLSKIEVKDTLNFFIVNKKNDSLNFVFR